MVITSRTHSSFFAAAYVSPQLPDQTPKLIRLPLSVAPQYETRCGVTGEIIPTPYKPLHRSTIWTTDEHERFLRGLELFPNGPWKEVANVVGTKTTRQTMTHAQKYRQKIERRLHAKSAMRKVIPPKASSAPPTTRPFREVLYSALHDPELAPASTATSVERIPTSPAEPWGDFFDTLLLDHEFQALIGSLQPHALPIDETPRQDTSLVEWQF